MQGYHSRPLIRAILQEYHSKRFSGCLFWGAIFGQHADSTGVAPVQMFASRHRIVVLFKRCHSKAVSSVSSVKLARASFQAVYAPQIVRFGWRARGITGEIRTLETEGCGTHTVLSTRPSRPRDDGLKPRLETVRPPSVGLLRKSPRVKPTHGAPTRTLLASEFVWSRLGKVVRSAQAALISILPRRSNHSAQGPFYYVRRGRVVCDGVCTHEKRGVF